MEKQSLVTYTVWALDVWGYRSDECPDGEDGCGEYGFTVNNRSRIGRLEVLTDEGASYNIEYRNSPNPHVASLFFTSWHTSTDEFVRRLIERGYLAGGVKASDVTIDGEDDELLTIDDATTGEPLLELEFEKATALEYYTVIVPYVTKGATEWHPTDPSFAPLTRGSFKTEGFAREWAMSHLGEGAQYEIRHIVFEVEP